MAYRSLLVPLAKYGIGIGLLTWVVGRNWSPSADGDSPGLAGILQRPVHLGPLFGAALLFLCSLLLSFYRWFLLVRAQDLPFKIGDALRLGLIGSFLGTFLPGAVGGDIVKAAFLAREQSRRTVSVATVLTDRVIGLWSLFWLVALPGGIFWLTGDPAVLTKHVLQIAIVSAIAVVAFTALLWLIVILFPAGWAEGLGAQLQRLPRFGTAAAEFWRAIWMYHCQWRWVLVAVLLSLIGHAGIVLAFYFAAHTFREPGQVSSIPSLSEHVLLVPVGQTCQSLFPSPGGLGAAEYAYGELYFLTLNTQAARDNGIAASLTFRMIAWGMTLMGYLAYLRMGSQVIVRPEDPTEEEETTLPIDVIKEESTS